MKRFKGKLSKTYRQEVQINHVEINLLLPKMTFISCRQELFQLIHII